MTWTAVFENPTCPSTDAALWTTRRRFGVAGGPDEVVLTDEGLARAFTVGAKVRRGDPAKALQLLWSQGGEGDFSVRKSGSARISPTALGRIDQITWGYLREKGYVESFPPDGVRLTKSGRSAVESGFEEQARLLERCKCAAGAR